MGNDIENKKDEKRQAKEQKREEKIQKQKDKAAQYERDIQLMKKEINENRQKNKDLKNLGPNEKKPNKKPSKASIIVIIILAFVLIFFFGNQFFSSAQEMVTDELSTSEFLQAVEQDRVENVIYESGSYTVNGTYYPNTSIGSTGVSAYNNAINAINDATSGNLPAIETQNLEGQNAPARQYTAIFVGQDSLLELMQKHPNVQYEIKLPSQ